VNYWHLIRNGRDQSNSKEWLVRVVAAAGPETGRTKATRQCEL